MMFPRADGGLIVESFIETIDEGEDGGAVARLKNGASILLNMSLDSLVARVFQTIPAQPGFSKLIYRFDSGNGDDYETHPIIGWRLWPPEQPAPITPYTDGTTDLLSFEGIRYPEGVVISGEALIFSDVSSWLEHAKSVEQQWRKDEANG